MALMYHMPTERDNELTSKTELAGLLPKEGARASPEVPISGELRGYRVCLPKKNGIRREKRTKAAKHEPSKYRESRIEGEKTVIANPKLPQATDTVHDTIKHERSDQVKNDAEGV
jgi:hypothetical protein